MEIVSWILQGLLAAMFIMAGLGKVSGSKMHRDSFDHLRLPQWFRVVTGLVELVGAALLIAGYWQTDFAMAGALVLGVTAIGGTLAHLRVKDGFKQTFMIVLLGIVSFVLVGIVS
ncbi:DoxX family membrane protein [Cohnella sp. CFH 77786]|uniref:DoxX family protein n=1 Tax=Cohnella sp. CFH 77786 TaxID=2662265 RepID=UPI001C608AD6|nr:DoxX family protein [Cohnella sp. CFH 77786]MBW5447105.1 DoxX family membrane protein [Cohnella sp. CFH 77786]